MQEWQSTRQTAQSVAVRTLGRLLLALDRPTAGWQVCCNTAAKNPTARGSCVCFPAPVLMTENDEVASGSSPTLTLERSPESEAADRLPASLRNSDTFAELFADKLPTWLIERAAELGYSTPTPVQTEAIDVLIDGRDAIVQAKTGSGKTLAYMLPLLAALKAKPAVQAIVVLPTAELAAQVALVARSLASASPERLMVMTLLDGPGASRQRKWIVAEPPQLIVGNVQQIDEFLRARLLQLNKLRVLVVDEVDACLADRDTSAVLQRVLGGLAFRFSQLAKEQVDPRTGRRSREIQQAVQGREERQTVFVSATLPQKNHFRKQCVQENWCRELPLLIHSEPHEKLPSQLRHGWAPCSASARLAALRLLLRRHEPTLTGAIIFLKSGMKASEMREFASLISDIIDEGQPEILAENTPINDRKNAVRAFRTGSRRLLLATFVGARGLDIPHCSHIYIVGIPDSHDTYLHMAGRCGRMGRPGLVNVFASNKEKFVLRRLANVLGIKFHDARKSDGEADRSDPNEDYSDQHD